MSWLSLLLLSIFPSRRRTDKTIDDVLISVKVYRDAADKAWLDAMGADRER